ncbi:thiolase [Pseudonocardia dioxanivorans CB1190]|uniref:Thiolase n=1 Tax=Pseudonocardia dioxanivorans (strain ATCC 55486 / DSM 44775 / JCM 13855 / CB1190) TaxID=675635 RepID=F4CTT1_PSEUX|nr:thiolase [Pseudonocardia dioxanivorans]AEA22890.1 thiolase [Pseudonocardia dioxanivorans CB1190]
MPGPSSDGFPAGAVITGAAEAGVAFDCGMAAIDLAVETALQALDDAGLTAADVDALLVAKGADLVPADRPTLELAEHLGLTLDRTDTTLAGGASPVVQIMHAAEAVAAGRCRTALVVYASTQASSRSRRLGGHARPAAHRSAQLEAAAGLLSPIGVNALAAARHMYEFGTTLDQLGMVAYSDRSWATRNPAALRREPLTPEQIAASPPIAEPLRRADCCLITDGAAAVVVERAGRRDARPVTLAGWAEAHRQYSLFGAAGLTHTLAARTGPAALDMAGIDVDDVGLVQLYDAFSILPLVLLEDLGFCPKGKGGQLLADGVTLPGGRLPMNTQGGSLSHCHPGYYGLFLVVEAVRQLRREAGDRQVDADWALCHAAGGGAFGGSQATLVLGAT